MAAGRARSTTDMHGTAAYRPLPGQDRHITGVSNLSGYCFNRAPRQGGMAFSVLMNPAVTTWLCASRAKTTRAALVGGGVLVLGVLASNATDPFVENLNSRAESAVGQIRARASPAKRSRFLRDACHLPNGGLEQRAASSRVRLRAGCR